MGVDIKTKSLQRFFSLSRQISPRKSLTDSRDQVPHRDPRSETKSLTDSQTPRLRDQLPHRLPSSETKSLAASQTPKSLADSQTPNIRDHRPKSRQTRHTSESILRDHIAKTSFSDRDIRIAKTSFSDRGICIRRKIYIEIL